MMMMIKIMRLVFISSFSFNFSQIQSKNTIAYFFNCDISKKDVVLEHLISFIYNLCRLSMETQRNEEKKLYLKIDR